MDVDPAGGAERNAKHRMPQAVPRSGKPPNRARSANPPSLNDFGARAGERFCFPRELATLVEGQRRAQHGGSLRPAALAMHALHIRLAEPRDAAAIAGLIVELGYSVTPQDVPARLERLAGSRGAAALVAERDGRVVGLATMHTFAVLNRARDVAWLTLLVVDASARRAGVGRQLVEAVERRARAAGAERLSVTSHEERAEAHAFYLGVGLTRTGRRFGKALDP